jgi:hypothetical protein
MPDARSADDELIALTRAYLTRRRGQPAPRDLESNALTFAFTHGRAKRVAVVAGTAMALAVGALTAGVVLAFHHQPSPYGASGSGVQLSVRIVRFPGNLTLPPVDRTIRDANIVAGLARDIENLPTFPTDERCPLDFGTYYSLTFNDGLSARPWTAKVGTEGCEIVQVTGQPVRWAAHAPWLWTLLSVALGFDPGEYPPTTSETATVVGAIQLRCSPPSATPAGAVQSIAGTVEVFVGSQWSANAPIFASETVAAGADFSFDLPPGTFVLMAVNPASDFSGPSVTVTVTPRESLRQDIPFPEACN